MRAGMTREFSLAECCRPEVLGIQPYRSGKPLAEIKLDPASLLRLASNENALGPPAAALEAMRNALAEAHRYPDGDALALKRALADRHGLTSGHVTLGNGSNDVLELVGRCFLAPGREVIYSRHAFAVYELIGQACGARARVAAPNAPDHAMPFGDNPDAILELAGPATAVAFVANPNNPTGAWLTSGQLRRLLQSLPASALVVVDEAYAEYAEGPDYPDASGWLDEFPNLVVTRTFSKFFALAGLRIGYSLSAPRIADLFNRVRQPFNVNALAQVAARAALDDKAHVAESLKMNRRGLEQLKHS